MASRPQAEFRLLDINLTNQFYVATEWPRIEEQIRVLKYGPMFAVFDRYGDIRSSGLGEHGLYYCGTRFLSRLALRLGDAPPLFLSSSVRSDNSLFSADLTNVDLLSADRVVLRRGAVHLVRSRLLCDGTCYEQLRLTNYGASVVELALQIEFAADFADIFEVRGAHRHRRGERLADIVTGDRAILQYRGLDAVHRTTSIHSSVVPAEVSSSHFLIQTKLRPRETTKLQFTVACNQTEENTLHSFDDVLAARILESKALESGFCSIETSNPQFDCWLTRSLADVRMMIVGNPEGGYPYAGVPWFSTVFGRDGIVTAAECLWVDPQIARGVLLYLAATQARDHVPSAEAEPGKIIHETRRGEMAALGEVPFGCYYGSVDATPLFIMLTGQYFQQTGDLDFIRKLWPDVERALSWIDVYGDRDGDGFVEYERQGNKGLIHQGWKDSPDSVFHADGSLAAPPIALCEVQGYVYAAKKEAASLARALGDTKRAALLQSQARVLRESFEKAFWCEELSTYALALDRNKRPCRVRTSNAGHCLYSGIAHPERAKRVADSLMGEDSFSGWGVRTVSALEPNYNPISYHNGSVWPHDNALLAAGLAQYGLTSLAARLTEAIFEVSLHFEGSRLPELLCGLHRRTGEGPTRYPVACSPQAWSAAAPFMLLKASLGLSLHAKKRLLVLDHPCLPKSISSLVIRALQLNDSTIDLRIERGAQGVQVDVMNKNGAIDVAVQQ